MDVKLQRDQPITKVTFVAILGGGDGAEWERNTIINPLKKMFDGRAKVQDAMNVMVDNVACCVSCGCTECCSLDGVDAVLWGLKMLAGRLAFCTPIKSMEIGMDFFLPSDLERYIKDSSVSNMTGSTASSDAASMGARGTKVAPAPQEMRASVDNYVTSFA